MTNFRIDLDRLPAPTVVQTLDYAAIRDEIISDFRDRYPEFDAVLESDLVVKLIEAVAYRELLLRARVNDAAKAVMLAYAIGSDLDQLAALYGVERMEAETDARLRTRTQLALEAYSASGTPDSYRWHALTAHVEVGEVAVVQPSPGRVDVIVYGTGAELSDEAFAVVRTRLARDDVKALTDMVSVRRAKVVSYDVEARLWLYAPPDTELVRAASEAAVRDRAKDLERLGHDIIRSAITAAAHVEGVQRVEIVSPGADIIIDDGEIAVLKSASVTVAGRAT